MSSFKNIRIVSFLGLFFLFLYSCEGMPGGDARKNPPDPAERVKKNLEEGRGFRLDKAFSNNSAKGGDFMFGEHL